ncbi:Uncharacterized RNA methyltransferase SAV1897 [Listeria grayi]|uniref:Uncharacterized RNA methyltransferase SAV1897 n=1 Tax=Listeria grayi TaxID=1641 RepID=A0A378M9I1_LISGR|nr:23S rRNA (uracil(1939)-C(5))-methyltransferase RlmD [Listeria grayi]STY43018.1 Uncharacterized RNA methyltransferase SAV1897 [Listeria grayi]
MKTNPVQEGQRFPLTIRRMGINGEGIGYYKRAIVFVPGAITGEEVVVEAKRIAPRYTEAEIKKIRIPSPNRVKPPCPVYEACGGCQLQHISYQAQLELKRDILIQALEKHTKFNIGKLPIKDVIGMDEPFRYRNKSQFQTRYSEDGNVVAGLYSANSHDLVPIDDCLVQDPATVAITNTVKEALQELNIPIYNEKQNSGIVRTIVVRTGFKTGQSQLVLITNSKKLPKKRALLEIIKQKHPEIISIMQNVNTQKSSLIFGEETMHLDGEETMQEALGEMKYDLSARAFFQLNPVQTEKLYNEVRRALNLSGTERIIDAYCGAGTIGLSLAGQVREVRGMDVIPEAIEDAKHNAALNQVTNSYYEVGKAETILPKWLEEGFQADAVILDPPRVGCDQALIRALLDYAPKQIVYVSCNPSTLARDLALFSKEYQINAIQPVDMFPQTAHVETVTVMQKR